MTLLAGLFLLPGLLRAVNYQEKLKENFKPFSTRGGFEFAYMVSKLSALQFLQAPYVACLMKVGLIFSILAGKFAFEEKGTSRKLLAASLIIAGIVLIILEQSSVL